MFDYAREDVRELLCSIRDDKSCNGAIKLFRSRGDFETTEAAILAGIACNRDARERFDLGMARIWSKRTKVPNLTINEVIIGGGLHAAIYASVRASEDAPAPLILEASDRIGGVFGTTDTPSFFLNSRNRPGNIGLPGVEGGALNVIPGGPIQPSDISGDEYQRNSDLAFAIRVAIALHADVMLNAKVENVDLDDDLNVRLRVGDDLLVTKRLINATGLGMENMPFVRSDRVMTFLDFMGKFDNAFPLRGIKRLAIIGAGDSGKAAIEAATGQGPSMRLSVASLDYVELIDWYGVPSECATREGWEANSRSRYKPIARLLPKGDGTGTYRVTPMTQRAKSVAVGYQAAYVNERPYDAVVVCTGFTLNGKVQFPSSWNSTDVVIGERIIAKSYETSSGVDVPVFFVGPAAGLDVTTEEKSASDALREVPENSTALFRYADRTATLAASFTRSFGIKAKLQQEPIAVDRNGNPIFVGDRVVEPAYGRPYKVLGNSEATDKEGGFIVLDRRGGFSVKLPDGTKRDNLFGVYAKETTVLEEDMLGIDSEGAPIRVGQFARTTGDDDFYEVLGTSDEDEGRIVLDRDGGFAVTLKDGTLLRSKYGAPGRSLVIRDRKTVKDYVGNEVGIGDIVCPIRDYPNGGESYGDVLVGQRFKIVGFTENGVDIVINARGSYLSYDDNGNPNGGKSLYGGSAQSFIKRQDLNILDLDGNDLFSGDAVTIDDVEDNIAVVLGKSNSASYPIGVYSAQLGDDGFVNGARAFTASKSMARKISA